MNMMPFLSPRGERHIYSKPDMEKYIKAISQWIDGIPYEKAFWNNVYRWKQTFNGMMQWSNYGGIIDLECFDANRFLSSCTSCKPKVLDVGCGLSYATGNYIEINGTKTALDLHYVDPLADVFNDIKKRYHRNLPDIEFGMVEYLSDFFPRHDADLIIIQNALDHSAMPIKGIQEAFSTLKTGGIYISTIILTKLKRNNIKVFTSITLTKRMANSSSGTKRKGLSFKVYLVHTQT